jgi:hypothetical protein
MTYYRGASAACNDPSMGHCLQSPYTGPGAGVMAPRSFMIRHLALLPLVKLSSAVLMLDRLATHTRRYRQEPLILTQTKQDITRTQVSSGRKARGQQQALGFLTTDAVVNALLNYLLLRRQGQSSGQSPVAVVAHKTGGFTLLFG